MWSNVIKHKKISYVLFIWKFYYYYEMLILQNKYTNKITIIENNNYDDN